MQSNELAWEKDATNDPKGHDPHPDLPKRFNASDIQRLVALINQITQGKMLDQRYCSKAYAIYQMVETHNAIVTENTEENIAESPD